MIEERTITDITIINRFPISPYQWTPDDGQRTLGRIVSVIIFLSSKIRTIVRNNKSPLTIRHPLNELLKMVDVVKNEEHGSCISKLSVDT